MAQQSVNLKSIDEGLLATLMNVFRPTEEALIIKAKYKFRNEVLRLLQHNPDRKDCDFANKLGLDEFVKEIRKLAREYPNLNIIIIDYGFGKYTFNMLPNIMLLDDFKTQYNYLDNVKLEGVFYGELMSDNVKILDDDSIKKIHLLGLVKSIKDPKLAKEIVRILKANDLVQA